MFVSDFLYDATNHICFRRWILLANICLDEHYLQGLKNHAKSYSPKYKFVFQKVCY
jgi:hypothetical protein